MDDCRLAETSQNLIFFHICQTNLWTVIQQWGKQVRATAQLTNQIWVKPFYFYFFFLSIWIGNSRKANIHNLIWKKNHSLMLICVCVPGSTDHRKNKSDWIESWFMWSFFYHTGNKCNIQFSGYVSGGMKEDGVMQGWVRLREEQGEITVRWMEEEQFVKPPPKRQHAQYYLQPVHFRNAHIQAACA